MDKKRGILIFASILLLIFVLNFVAAQPQLNDAIEGIQKFFKPLLGAIFGSSENIFEELLFALIIIAAVYMALDRVPIIRTNAFSQWVITIAVAVLAVRFIATEGLVNLLLLPQGVLGVALIVFIPFLVWFWFVEFGLTGSRVLRKIAWVVFAVVYAFLWWRAYYILDNQLKQWNHLYLVIAIVSVLLLLLDGTIQRAFAKSRQETQKERYKAVGLSKLNKRFEELHDLWLDERDPTRKSLLKAELDSVESAIKLAHQRT